MTLYKTCHQYQILRSSRSVPKPIQRSPDFRRRIAEAEDRISIRAGRGLAFMEVDADIMEFLNWTAREVQGVQ